MRGDDSLVMMTSYYLSLLSLFNMRTTVGFLKRRIITTHSPFDGVTAKKKGKGKGGGKRYWTNNPPFCPFARFQKQARVFSFLLCTNPTNLLHIFFKGICTFQLLRFIYFENNFSPPPDQCFFFYFPTNPPTKIQIQQTHQTTPPPPPYTSPHIPLVFLIPLPFLHPLLPFPFPLLTVLLFYFIFSSFSALYQHLTHINLDSHLYLFFLKVTNQNYLLKLSPFF